jgi:hypothetical protein
MLGTRGCSSRRQSDSSFRPSHLKAASLLTSTASSSVPSKFEGYFIEMAVMSTRARSPARAADQAQLPSIPTVSSSSQGGLVSTDRFSTSSSLLPVTLGTGNIERELEDKAALGPIPAVHPHIQSKRSYHHYHMQPDEACTYVFLYAGASGSHGAPSLPAGTPMFRVQPTASGYQEWVLLSIPAPKAKAAVEDATSPVYRVHQARRFITSARTWKSAHYLWTNSRLVVVGSQGKEKLTLLIIPTPCAHRFGRFKAN